ncbi:MAG: sugar ABC transporter permease, partial [Clostridia bacterium]|nr:sugar ABC transporter permease [Clostridia bacterium]
MQDVLGFPAKKKFRLTKKFIVKELFVAAMLIYPLAQFAVFYVYMNFNNLLMAFKGMRTDGSTYWVGLENFYKVINGVDSGLILIALINNLKMFALTLVIGMPMNILFGYYLYKKKPGSTAVRIVYMLPHMVSGVVMTLLFMKFVELGLPTLWNEL